MSRKKRPAWMNAVPSMSTTGAAAEARRMAGTCMRPESARVLGPWGRGPGFGPEVGLGAVSARTGRGGEFAQEATRPGRAGEEVARVGRGVAPAGPGWRGPGSHEARSGRGGEPLWTRESGRLAGSQADPAGGGHLPREIGVVNGRELTYERGVAAPAQRSETCIRRPSLGTGRDADHGAARAVRAREVCGPAGIRPAVPAAAVPPPRPGCFRPARPPSDPPRTTTICIALAGTVAYAAVP